MYYSEAIMSKMASDKILALKLESALSGVKQQVIEQASRIQEVPHAWPITPHASLIIIRMSAPN